MSLFCLVHGSSQSAQGWKLLIPELENRRHSALTVNLPTNEPQASATRYADVIVEALDQTHHEMSEVVVVAHSASGMFLPLVAARRHIRHMIFLAAVIPKLGTSILEQFQANPSMFNPDWIGKNPMEEDVARRFLFHDCAADIMEWALTTRCLMNTQEAMREVCPLDAWPNVSSSYVVCADDRTISPWWSRQVARERLGIEATEFPGGHCPYVSRPSQLAHMLISTSIATGHSV